MIVARRDPGTEARPKPRPFLKWAGGKRQLLEKLTSGLPGDIRDYHEPFLGGGALFFELAHRRAFRKAFLSDLNGELIEVYKAVRGRTEELIPELGRMPHSEDFYYRLRDADSGEWTPVRVAARFLYLNKTCYNGLYRVNAAGRFNVPFGRYRNPAICDPVNLRLCARALRGVSLRRAPFGQVLARAEKGDLVYFDPPYHPVSRTANFASYAKTGFREKDHEELRDLFLALHRKGCRVMLSNSHTPFTLGLFKGLGGAIRVEEVRASRAVNSDPSRRGPVREILVRNF